MATVDGEPITVRDVARELVIAGAARRRWNGRQDDPWFLAMRDQLVSRRLVEKWLRESQQAASAAEIDLAREQLVARQAQRGVKWEDYLEQQQLDESRLHRALAWQIAWGRFLDKQLQPANLEKYFHKHRRDFDGTELRVAHIVWPLPPQLSATLVREVHAMAQDVVERIRRGEITFEAAARQYSSGPSREQGGDIGWIARREPMPESFSAAAFALEPQQVSAPVETAVGIHIIRCLDVRPGKKELSEVLGEVETRVTRYLFEWAADQVRERTRIEYPEVAASQDSELAPSPGSS
ncbi:MAG: peptidylprolyl isomerase [Pirellulaceae bacterium]